MWSFVKPPLKMKRWCVNQILHLVPRQNIVEYLGWRLSSQLSSFHWKVSSFLWIIRALTASGVGVGSDFAGNVFIFAAIRELAIFSHLLLKFLIMPHMHAGGRNYLLISQKRAFCVSRQIKVIPWQGRHKFSPAITSRSFASILSFVYSALSHLVCSAIYGILSARVSKGLEFWGSRLFTKLASVKLLDWWKNTTFLTNRFSRI